MHKRGATFLAPTAFAIADSPLSPLLALPSNGCLPVHSPLNFLSSFLMRALMHMRGSRFYSKLAAIALSYFFNAPRALISRPPIVKTFRQRQDVRRCTANPFTFEQVRVLTSEGGRHLKTLSTCRSVWGISHIGPKVSSFPQSPMGSRFFRNDQFCAS